jgi:hypothetical protein
LKVSEILTSAVGLGVIHLLVPSFSFATLLTFDDLTPISGNDYIPDGFGGLKWDLMQYMNSNEYGGHSGYKGGTVSGDYVAFNPSGLDVSVFVADSTFDFNSAHFAAAWRNGLNVTVKGFLNDVELYSQTVTGLNYSQTKGATATLVTFNFLGIDELTFSSWCGTDAVPDDGATGTHFTMDNFLFNATVPEPSTLILLEAGFLGLIGYARHRKQGGR